jgi:hypothetical protein
MSTNHVQTHTLLGPKNLVEKFSAQAVLLIGTLQDHKNYDAKNNTAHSEHLSQKISICVTNLVLYLPSYLWLLCYLHTRQTCYKHVIPLAHKR